MGHFQQLVTFIVLLMFSIVSCKPNLQLNTHQTFIVRVQNNLKPKRYSNHKTWYKSTLKSLSSSINSSNSQTQHNHGLLHVYNTVFHGFSARFTPQQAEELTNRPEILLVLPDRLLQLQTTRTPQFMGLIGTKDKHGIINESDSGSNVIIGVLDTGIWPEHVSFNDQDLGPVPSHWKGKCDGGDNFPENLCNKKLIGARYYLTGSLEQQQQGSARDTDGHGTHTTSTIAGRHVPNASFLGFAQGIANGVAPKSRIAVYKVCSEDSCSVSDILAGIDAAVEDGVDVISISIGGDPVPYHEDAIAIGAFGAIENGVLFSASGGNNGPTDSTISNVAPWITTVGASTIDRRFPADLVLGDGSVITGSSLYKGDGLSKGKYLPLIYAGNTSNSKIDNATCLPGTLNKDLVSGKIVLCDRGIGPRIEKAEVVREAGGVGLVLANVEPMGEGIVADAFLIPGLAITQSKRTTVLQYIKSTKNPKATFIFKGTQLGVKPAPVVASFSSRGPNSISPSVLKPDIIAPGVNILAAWPDGVPPTEVAADKRRTEFNIISGTSMSCPHVSGVAALLKGAHPDWSPAMIKSALMTTAYADDHDGKTLLDEKDNSVSSVFGFGAGHVDPNKAVDPGLVYDLTVDDYLNFLCASNFNTGQIEVISRRKVSCSGVQQVNMWDLNYPSISVSFDTSAPSKSEVVVNRTVTYVGDGDSIYTVNITNPKGVTVAVDQEKLIFKKKGQKQSYMVRILSEKVGLHHNYSGSESGCLVWTDGKHQVTSPIVVTWS
ncbi:subtilisin-like protease SBT1.5 [Quercus suber]|uniref:subtilisin-like protease SBT1.5 n=1 Tax=Quercus suber TaxID=58331 RepID=UPI0032DF54CD